MTGLEAELAEQRKRFKEMFEAHDRWERRHTRIVLSGLWLMWLAMGGTLLWQWMRPCVCS